jgi:ABC-type multidrug transport system fused ATPase/permease subunit
VLAISGTGGLTLGKLASFLTFNRSFNMPIAQVSMQLNSIVMGLAGADRVFKLLDEEPEKDDGYVTLVRAKAGADGSHHRMPGAHGHLGVEALPQGRRHHGLRGAQGRHRHGRRGLRLQ